MVPKEGHLEIDKTKAIKYEANLLEKIKIEVAVNDDFLQPTVEAIQRGSKDRRRLCRERQNIRDAA